MARIRIKDIAAQAGVSASTVSKYLNGHNSEMSAATRERIADVIERTGYRPSSVARNLRLDRSRTLGVILADIRNPYSGAMLEELSSQAGALGYALTCAISGNDPAKEAAALRRLLESGVDGLVVNTCGDNDAQLLETDRRTPVVLLDRDVAGSRLDLVTSDNCRLISGLVDEVACGPGMRLHLVTEADPTSSIRRERARQFMRELSTRGLSGSTLALPGDADEAARELSGLARVHTPLGLIAVNGLVFQQLVEAIALAGLAVPEQVRLATFDEYPWNRVLFGGVTTAAQDTRGIAASTLERLVGRIDAKATGTGSADTDDASGSSAWKPLRIEIPGRIIARASTR